MRKTLKVQKKCVFWNFQVLFLEKHRNFRQLKHHSTAAYACSVSATELVLNFYLPVKRVFQKAKETIP